MVAGELKGGKGKGEKGNVLKSRKGDTVSSFEDDSGSRTGRIRFGYEEPKKVREDGDR